MKRRINQNEHASYCNNIKKAKISDSQRKKLYFKLLLKIYNKRNPFTI